MLQVKVHFVAQ